MGVIDNLEPIPPGLLTLYHFTDDELILYRPSDSADTNVAPFLPGPIFCVLPLVLHQNLVPSS